MDSQNWRQPLSLFKHMFEMYNLASALQDYELDFTSQEYIKSFSDCILTRIPHAFTSNLPHPDTDKGRSSPNKRPRKKTNTSNGSGGGENTYDHQAVDAFVRARHTLESNDEDESGRLNKVKQPITLSVDLNRRAPCS